MINKAYTITSSVTVIFHTVHDLQMIHCKCAFHLWWELVVLLCTCGFVVRTFDLTMDAVGR